MSKQSPIEGFIENKDLLLLDGGLATELEVRGHDLNTHLWSAKLLKTDPEAIRDVHYSYLEAGADCITSASYQASIEGFLSVGLSEQEAKSLLIKSIDLANEAREMYLMEFSEAKIDKLQPLIAASIGPYGAFLADGAEYRGNYGVPNDILRAFHETRWQILADAQVDLFACETIPSFQEAEVLLDLLQATPEIFAWVSFSCKDGEHISDGSPIKDCASLFNDCSQVVAIGINCTAPKHISSLIDHIRAGAPNKRVAVYPNSGEIYDGATKSWLGTSDPLNCGTAAAEWYARGARLIGGCCRMGPAHIKAMSKILT
jgi:homocysteine S-methyltransferase